MLKQIAWNTFKNTGNINTMMELIEMEKTIKEKQMNDEKLNEKNDITNNSIQV